jgi:tetratricopeptide (TPR) repeat protein
VLLGVFVNATGMFKEKIFIVKNIWVRVFFISIIIFGFIFGFVNLGRDTLSGSYLEESEIAFKNKNIDAAENLCNASIRLDNDNAGVYFLLGKIHIAKKDYLKAISCFKSAVKHNSFCSVFYYELAMSYLNWMHKSNDLSVCRYAGDAFMKAVEFYPSNSFYRLQLAQFYELNNQPGSAVVEYENCIGLNKKVQEEQDKYPAKLLKNLILSPEIIIQVEDRIKSITSLSK